MVFFGFLGGGFVFFGFGVRWGGGGGVVVAVAGVIVGGGVGLFFGGGCGRCVRVRAFVGCDEVIEVADVELFYDVQPALERQLRVEDGRTYVELLEEEFEAVATVDRVGEEEAFALEQPELLCRWVGSIDVC